MFILPAQRQTQQRLLTGQILKKFWGFYCYWRRISASQSNQKPGLDDFIGQQLQLDQNISLLAMTLGCQMVFLTEVTSNTATTASFYPAWTGIGDGAQSAKCVSDSSSAGSQLCV